MSKVMIVSKDKEQYFFPYIKSKNIISVNPKKTSSVFLKVIKKMIVSFNLPFYKFILGDWVSEIDKIDKLIILDSGYVYGMKEYLQRLNKECEIHLFIWNHINEENLKIINDFNHIHHTWTFVKQDSEKYGLRLNSTLYTKDILLEEAENKYELLFVGREKGKAEDILHITSKLRDMGYSSKIHMIKSQQEYPDDIKKYISEDFIEYDKYLSMISQTTALLDMTEPGNHGLSMRVLESIYFNKKLITNNIMIKNEPFYKDSNVYIIDDSQKKPLSGIKDFFEKSFEPYSNDILEYYSIECWSKRFNS